MKFSRKLIPVISVLALLLVLAAPLTAQTPTPTVTPTPLTVAANSTYTLCSITAASGVCGRIRKAATQVTTASYQFQMTSGSGSFSIWTSCDNDAGGTSRQVNYTLTRIGAMASIPASVVGPCTLGVTPRYGSGTLVLKASINGDLTMLALPTPGP